MIRIQKSMMVVEGYDIIELVGNGKDLETMEGHGRAAYHLSNEKPQLGRMHGNFRHCCQISNFVCVVACDVHACLRVSQLLPTNKPKSPYPLFQHCLAS